MSKNRPNETELLKASIQGNPQAFGAIVAKYQSLVCAITFSATGDLEESEELAQQAFVNVWQNLTKLDDLTKFQSWLCATTRNVIRNFFRSQKRTAMRTQQNVENLIEAEAKMLGDNADQRIEAASLFANKFFPEAALPAIERMCESHEGIIALEAIMEAMKDGSFSGDTQASAGLSQTDLEGMVNDPRYYKDRDPHFIAQVTKGYEQLYNKRS